MKKKTMTNKKLTREGRGYNRLTLPTWYIEGLNDWSKEEILERLRQVGLPMDEVTFRSDASSYSEPGEMADRWTNRVNRDPGRWRDFLQLAARELWKRFLPDHDTFDWFIDDWEAYQEKLKDRPEKKRIEADIPELLQMLDRLDSLLKAMSQEKELNLHECVMEISNLYNYGLLDWLIELPFELAGDGFVDQAVDVARRYTYFAPATLMGDLGYILARAGRCAEANEQILENLKSFPEDPWVIIKGGDALDRCGKPDQAEQLYLQALEMTADGYTQDGALERLVPLYSRLGKSEEIENLKKQYPPDQTDDDEERKPVARGGRDSSLSEIVPKRTKIGRNDPCPCGSGKKFKKCCLLKEIV
jgi:tetratricopeptide (TPR) repeat protein